MTDSELLTRIEKLERDNRRLKRFGLAALALVAGLGLVAAARPIPKVIKAHEFAAVDAAGKIQVTMSADSGLGPSVDLYGKKGLPILQISDYGGPQILVGVHPNKGNGYFVPDVSISDSPSGQPSIALNDAKGFEMVLGSTKTQDAATGATQQSSADSILMFGNGKHHVIWQAP